MSCFAVCDLHCPKISVRFVLADFMSGTLFAIGNLGFTYCSICFIGKCKKTFIKEKRLGFSSILGKFKVTLHLDIVLPQFSVHSKSKILDATCSAQVRALSPYLRQLLESYSVTRFCTMFCVVHTQGLVLSCFSNMRYGVQFCTPFRNVHDAIQQTS